MNKQGQFCLLCTLLFYPLLLLSIRKVSIPCEKSKKVVVMLLERNLRRFYTSRGKKVVLECFAMLTWGICTSYMFTIRGTSISWMPRLQKSVSLSATEAKYMAIAKAGKELIWLKDFLSKLGLD